MEMVDGRPFECTKCGKCCRWGGHVYLKPADINQLCRATQQPYEEFLKRYTQDFGSDKVLKDSEGSSDCVCLEGDKCTVYTSRPEQCKKFPEVYDPRCPGFHKEKEGAMQVQYEEAVKRVNERFSASQEYVKAVSDNLYKELQSGVKTASVTSKALEDGIDAFFKADKIKIASLADLFSFDRVDKEHLIHKSTHDLWSIESDDEGSVQIMRLFDGNGDPIKG